MPSMVDLQFTVTRGSLIHYPELATIAELLSPKTRIRASDARIIARLSPLTHLPLPVLTLARPHERLQPPILYCGWFIDIEDFRALAVMRNISHMRLSDSSSLDVPMDIPMSDDDRALLDEWLGDDPEERQLAEQESADYDMCTTLADDIMNELGIRLPITYSHVVAVLGEIPRQPKSFVRLGFALYNNYHREERPSVIDVQRIKDAFAFEGEPGWLMDAIETSWRETSEQ